MNADPRLRLRYAATATGLLWGSALFARPSTVLALLRDGSPTQLEIALTRTLGARHVVEAVALAVPTRHTRRPLLLTEATHAASMVALALASPRHRRAALASLLVAVALGAATAAATRPSSSRSIVHS